MVQDVERAGGGRNIKSDYGGRNVSALDTRERNKATANNWQSRPDSIKTFVRTAVYRRHDCSDLLTWWLHHARNEKGQSFELAYIIDLFGSPTWARTRDLRINSPSLYRLSYRGTEEPRILDTWMAGVKPMSRE